MSRQARAVKLSQRLNTRLRASAAAVSSGIVTNGLVMHLDAGNAASYAGSGATWTDLSGSGNNATLVNSPTFNSSDGGSLVFNGSNQYATTAFSFGGRPFSIETWVRFTNQNGYQTVTGQDTPQSTNFGRFYHQKTDTSGGGGRPLNAFGFSLVNTANAEVYCYDTSSIVLNIWYQYTISLSASQLILHRNGSAVTTVNNSDTLASGTGNTIIAAGYFSNNIVDYLDGRIAISRFYNVALSAAEIQQNFNANRARFGL